MSVLLAIKTGKNTDKGWMIWRDGMLSSGAGINGEEKAGESGSRVFPGGGNVDNQATRQRWRTRS